MERVMIIGCGGAGKSTLARKLGEKTGLPVVHLDQIYWEPGNWQHLEKPVFLGWCFCAFLCGCWFGVC